MAVCPYAPLAGGFLTGKYERRPDGSVLGPDGSRADLSGDFGPFSEHAWTVLGAVREVAEETGASEVQVALRWAMEVDGLTSVPIVGARSVDQLDENVGAVEVTLTEEQLDRISEAGLASDSTPWPVYSS